MRSADTILLLNFDGERCIMFQTMAEEGTWRVSILCWDDRQILLLLL